MDINSIIEELITKHKISCCGGEYCDDEVHYKSLRQALRELAESADKAGYERGVRDVTLTTRKLHAQLGGLGEEVNQ